MEGLGTGGVRKNIRWAFFFTEDLEPQQAEEREKAGEWKEREKKRKITRWLENVKIKEDICNDPTFQTVN